MGRKDIHTNIMLDLECTSIIYPNPVILEIAAVHFNLDSGAEISSLSTLVSYQSCLDHGLVEDQGTLDWLQENIPETLEKAKSCAVTLPQALFKLSKFIRASCKATEDESLKRIGRKNEGSQPMIWGNGSTADNIWIKSAYSACDMERPWQYYNDMCVRTMVHQCQSITGKNFRRLEKFIGSKHVALDDCRHQIKYLVKARNTWLSRSENLNPVISESTAEQPVQYGAPVPSEPLPQQRRRERQPRTRRIAKANPIRSPSKKQVCLPTPDQSFVGMEETRKSVLPQANLQLPQWPTAGNGLITPETSFSRNIEEDEADSPPAFERMATPPISKRQRLSPVLDQTSKPGNREGMPLSPDVSFCVGEVDQVNIIAAAICSQTNISPNTTLCDANGDQGSDTETDEPKIQSSKPLKLQLSVQQLAEEERILDTLELQHEKILATLSPSSPPLSVLETTKSFILEDDSFSEEEKILPTFGQDRCVVEKDVEQDISAANILAVKNMFAQKNTLSEEDVLVEKDRLVRLDIQESPVTITIEKSDSIVIEGFISKDDEDAFIHAELENVDRGQDFGIEDMDDEEIPDSFWRARSKSP